jgi:hypothetical protein
VPNNTAADSVILLMQDFFLMFLVSNFECSESGERKEKVAIAVCY